MRGILWVFLSLCLAREAGAVRSKEGAHAQQHLQARAVGFRV